MFAEAPLPVAAGHEGFFGSATRRSSYREGKPPVERSLRGLPLLVAELLPNILCTH